MHSGSRAARLCAATLLGLSALLTACEQPPPDLAPEQITAAVAAIKAYAEVTDAAIAQKGKRLTLELTIVAGKSEEQARELGESFVRMVKLIAPEPDPEAEVGQGLYDYQVRVYAPDHSLIAEGTKASDSDRLSW